MDTEFLQRELQKLIEECGAHLVGLEVHGSQKQPRIDVFADTEDGISAKQLAVISRAIAPHVARAVGETIGHTLDVSSPGLDRPLRFDWQYRRHSGREIDMLLRDTAGEEKTGGRILREENGFVHLDTGEREIAIALDDVVEAKIRILVQQRD